MIALRAGAAAAAVLPALLAAGCSTTRTATDYYQKMGHQIDVVVRAEKGAEMKCWDYRTSGCFDAVHRYKLRLLAARDVAVGLEPPDGAHRAHRTARRAIRVALGAARRAERAIPDRDAEAWTLAVRETDEAGTMLALALKRLR